MAEKSTELKKADDLDSVSSKNESSEPYDGEGSFEMSSTETPEDT